jgi:hypothetical protein
MGNAELNGVARAVGDQFARQNAAIEDRIAAIMLTAQAAQDAAAELRTELAQRDAEIRVLRMESATTATTARDAGANGVADVLFDTGRIVVRCANGRELAVDIPRPDLDAVAVLVVERHLDRLRGEKGEKGDDGAQAVVDLDELATVLRAEPDFVAQVRGDPGPPGPPGQPASPWSAGVYRSGVRCSHFIGRVYEATADTTDEPGDSPAWRRIDSTGMRHVGPAEPREPGDLHTKDRATYLFDGAKSWLLCAKAFTDADAEHLFNPLRQDVKTIMQRTRVVDSRSAASADLASVANATATRAMRWIEQRAEALDALLRGDS